MSAPRAKFDWFVGALIAVTALAWIAPGPGSRGGVLHSEVTTRLGVALVFFIHGMGLPLSALRAGSLRWKVHGVVQAATFVAFPLFGLALYLGLSGFLSEEMRLGLLFLCAAPSTISSSVAMTAIARGNVAEALFNATLSSLLGMLLTPLWIAAVLTTQGGSIDVGSVFGDLLRLLVLPVVVGQLLRPVTGAWVDRHRGKLGVLDRGVILFLVYAAFCDSVVNRTWSTVGFGELLLLAGGCAGLLGLSLFGLDRLSRTLGFSRGERVAALFCGSQKSLASGLPIANVLFAGNPALSVLVLPLMLYHALQLVLSASLAARLAREGDDT
jgi:sodium/bile acid cotransporter 7